MNTRSWAQRCCQAPALAIMLSLNAHKGRKEVHVLMKLRHLASYPRLSSKRTIWYCVRVNGWTWSPFYVTPVDWALAHVSTMLLVTWCDRVSKPLRQFFYRLPITIKELIRNHDLSVVRWLFGGDAE